MGALEVVDAAELVEASLLGSQVGPRRQGGLPLEIAVHALVPRVLLRLPRFDELGDNAERDPPDRELGEPGDRIRGEGVAVVGPDAPGEAELPEEVAEALQGGLQVEPQHAAAFEQESGVAVLHGEREAQMPVPGAEFAFEIRRPGGVGLLRVEGRRTRVGAAPPRRAGFHLAVPLEDAVDRVHRGNARDVGIILEHAADLTGSPASALAYLEHPCDDFVTRRVSARVRPA